MFLDPIDNLTDYFYEEEEGEEEPVTEVSDQELRRLGFPVPTEPGGPEEEGDEPPEVPGHHHQSGFAGFAGIESPFIEFTSRENRSTRRICPKQKQTPHPPKKREICQ